MSKVEEGKFVRMFGRSEIRLTACAVTKDRNFNNVVADIIIETNQFWNRYPPHHERALLKMYMKNPGNYSISKGAVWVIKIPMEFLGNDSNDGWGELQFLIKVPRLVRLARHRSFDTRVNQWVEETKPIQPRTDHGDHYYLSLRFYHQDHLPPVPNNWRWEPVYVSIMSQGDYSPLRGMAGAAWEFDFYKIEVFWEKEVIKITVTALESNSLEIPKHMK